MGEIGSGNNSSYPGALDTNAIPEVNSPAAGKTKARKEPIEDLTDAVIKIETELGTDPAGSLADVKTFLQTQHQTDGTHKSTHGPHVWIDAADYDTLTDAANAAIGKTLVISSSINLTLAEAGGGAVVIPATVLGVFPMAPGVINKNTATSLTINAPVVGNPMHQWLSGFSASEISGLKEANVETFGALTNGSDVSTELQLAFDWWMRGSSRHLTMRGSYRCNSQMNIYSPSGIAAHNCVLDAEGAEILSYVSGKALVIGTDGTEDDGTTDGTSFENNIIHLLRVRAGSANVTTLLKIGGWQVYASKIDVILHGFVSDLTTQGLLIYGANAYYNDINNLIVWDCEYPISVNKDWQAGTTLTASARSNANRINGASIYGYGVSGCYLTHTTGNRFTNMDFTNASSANEDVYLDTNATDNVITARHESGATYTHTINDGADGNMIETNKNLALNASALAARQNTIIKYSSTNSKIDINALRSRYLYNHAGQPLSMRHDVYNSGNDAIYIDSNGPVLHAPRIISDVAGLADEVRLTALVEDAGGGATTLPTADATHGPAVLTGSKWFKIYLGTGAYWVPAWPDS